jgi:hypothetical protein
MNYNPKDGWMGQIGMPLIEAGAIYLILRLLFIRQGEDNEIEAL